MLERLKYQYKLMAYAIKNGISHMPVSIIEGCYERDEVVNRVVRD